MLYLSKFFVGEIKEALKMRKLKLFILLVCVTQAVNAATSRDTLFQSGFEVEISSEWGTRFENGLPTYERNTISARSGDYGFEMEFSDVAHKGNLYTPKSIVWEAGLKYEISFWYKGLVPSDNSATNLKFFDGNGVKIGQINLNSWTSTSWTKYSMEFTPDMDGVNGEILFSFRPTNSGGGHYYLDDFVVIKVTPEPSYWNDLKTKRVESDSSITWVQFGPGMSGNNKCAHWHPTEPDLLFIGPNMGNSYRTGDQGMTYQTIYDVDAPGFRSGLRGPQEVGSVDFSRQDPDYGFCTDERIGGLFLTTDRGVSWERPFSNANFGNAYLACVAVDPKDENTWYLGAGRMRELGKILFTLEKPHGIHTDQNSQSKIWKSTDKGMTWTMINAGLHPKAEVETIVVDPVHSNIIYASTNYGFYKSTDAGVSWVQKSAGLDNDVLRCFSMMHQKENDSLTMYVINSVMWKDAGSTIADSLGGIFRSDDRGESWSKVNGDIALDMTQWEGNADIEKSFYHTVAYYFGLTDDLAKVRYPDMPSSITQRFNHITVDPNDPDNVYLCNKYSNADENNFKPGQIYRTKNGGDHWYVTFRNGKNWNSGPDLDYWTARGNPLGTNITLKYLDRWVNRDAYERKSCNFTCFNSDGTVLHTQMAKISLMSYDKGDTWVDIDDEASTPGTQSWVGAGNSNVPGHGFFQHPHIPNKVFCSAGENSLWVTNDEGENVRAGAQAASYVMLQSGETSLSHYCIHPDNTDIRYALFFRQESRGKLLKTVNGGSSWFVQGVAVPLWDQVAGAGDQSVHQLCMLIDWENPDNMYFTVPNKARNIEYVGNSVTAWGVHKSSDGGKTWAEANNGIPDSRDISRIAFDPDDPMILYAAVMGINGGLFKSTDRAGNWTEVESTLSISANLGINDIHFSKDGKIYITAGYSYANSDAGGLWVSNDGMDTWERIFDFPWVNRVETAHYDPKTILISTLANNNIDLKNPGAYLSKDGGASWIKINQGNGQSDRINDIAIEQYRPGRYYLSTYGSGWYAARDTNVVDIEPETGISIDQDTIFLFEGESLGAAVEVSPNDATFTDRSWKSDNTSVAKVNSRGLVSAVSEGTAIITARLVNSQLQDSVYVVVKKQVIEVTDIMLEADSVYLFLGEDTVLNVQVEPLDAMYNELVWMSRDPELAVVDENGSVEALGIGQTFIHVSPDNSTIADSTVIIVSDTSTNVFDHFHNEISVYPNPARNVVYISCDPEMASGSVLSLFSLSGSKVFQAKVDALVKSDTGEFLLSLDGMEHGIYMLKINHKGGLFYAKTIKTQY